MPPRTRKRKASVGEFGLCVSVPPKCGLSRLKDSIESEDPGAKKSTTKASRTAPQQTQRQRKNGVVPDISEDSTRRPAGSTAASNKKKLNVHEIKKDIQKDGETLISFIDEELRKNPPTFDQALILEQIPPEIASSLPWIMKAGEENSSPISEDTPQASAKAAMEGFQGIIDTYEKLNTDHISSGRPDYLRWDRDAKELSEFNRRALGATAQIINQSIMPGPHPSTIKPPERGGDLAKMAHEMMEEARPQEGEETWGTTAHSQVNAFTSILRSLPNEKDPKKKRS